MISRTCFIAFPDLFILGGFAIVMIAMMIVIGWLLAFRLLPSSDRVISSSLGASAQRKLEALEIKLSTLLEGSSSIIAQTRVYLDGSWDSAYFSPNCEKLYGYSAEAFMTDSNLWISRVVPEDKERVIIPIFEEIFAGRLATMEYRFRHRDGTLYWISDSVTPSWDATANCWIVTCVQTNITSRKQAEAALRQSEERSRIFFEHAGIAMNLLDATGRYLRRW
jgi:PAS domain S-box-containing protein